MTAQRGDSLIHKGKSYNIAAATNPIGFNPEDYGLFPQSICTDCWRGYWCDYEIRNNGFYLKDLYIYTQDGHYPRFNRVRAKAQKKDSANFGYHKYEDVFLFIPYTGKVLAGSDFIWKYSRHMVFQSPYAYRSLMEFTFKDGILKEEIDYSKSAEEVRKWIDASEPGEGRETENIAEYVRKSFSLDYMDKAWWLQPLRKMQLLRKRGPHEDND